MSLYLFSRRDFLKTSAVAGVGLAASGVVADLLAQSKGRALESTFKGLGDIALGEAKRLGCSYADVRFTRNINDSVSVRDRVVTDSFGFGGRGREESAGFGVRVIHGGVWGFASSPLVTEDEIRRVTRVAADVAKASAISKKTDVKLAPEKNACCKGGVAAAWPGYNKGILWRQDDKAWADARTAKKLVMVFELVGDLDKEGC